MSEKSYQEQSDLVMGLAQRVLGGELLTQDEAMSLSEVSGQAVYDLFFWANKIRIKFVGEEVKFCSIIAAKVGACSEDCGYCAQSKHYETHVSPMRLDVDEMQDAMAQARANGADSIGIVNSGRGPTDKDFEWLKPFYDHTIEEGGIRPCATLGQLSEHSATKLKEMGVQRINHNIETSKRHFPNVVSTHTYDDRVETLKNAKAAGLSICSGGIFGMGEDWEDRKEMAFALREIGADVVPINFLNAIQGTPLYEKEGVEELQPLEALKILAFFRFILPHAEIKVAGGREKILRDMQSWAFYAGASSFLIGNYLTTFGRTPEQDHQMLKDLGLNYRTFDETGKQALAADEVAGNPHAVPGEISLPVMN